MGSYQRIPSPTTVAGAVALIAVALAFAGGAVVAVVWAWVEGGLGSGLVVALFILPVAAVGLMISVPGLVNVLKSRQQRAPDEVRRR